jgi:uncharacterized Ntn-hydrolase superfamily protein
VEREQRHDDGRVTRAVLENRTGFEKDAPKSGDHRPTTEWPFQRFSWADHSVNSTNPRLGHLGLHLLRAGYSAPRVLEEIAASDQFVERRQLGCLDVSGLAAARTGAENKPWAGHRVDRNVVVTANAVVSAEVADAMFDAFQRGADLALWERPLRSLEAGKAAGGQPNGEVSGGLFVVDREPYPMVDLRVDLHPEPVAELRRLADAYVPLVPYYNLRPRDPNLPSTAEWLAARRRRVGD